MMNSLKFKIFSGFLFLALLFVIYMLFAVYHLVFIQDSFSKALKENYTSIMLTTEMIEYSERMDSDILSSFTGDTFAKESFYKHLKALLATCIKADSNITIKGEDFLLNNIKNEANRFAEDADLFFKQTENDTKLKIYTQQLQQIFQQLKNELYELLKLNEINMYSLEQENNSRADMLLISGIITGVFALLFCLVFGWWIGYSVAKPIKNIASLVTEKDPNLSQLPPLTGIREIDTMITALQNRNVSGSDQ